MNPVGMGDRFRLGVLRLLLLRPFQALQNGRRFPRLRDIHGDNGNLNIRRALSVLEGVFDEFVP